MRVNSVHFFICIWAALYGCTGWALSLTLIKEVPLKEPHVANRGFSADDRYFYLTDRNANGTGRFGDITLSIFDAHTGIPLFSPRPFPDAPKSVEIVSLSSQVFVVFPSSRADELGSMTVMDLSSGYSYDSTTIGMGTTKVSVNQETRVLLGKNPMFDQVVYKDLKTGKDTRIGFRSATQDLDVEMAGGVLLFITQTDRAKGLFQVYEVPTGLETASAAEINERAHDRLLGSFHFDVNMIAYRNLDYALLKNRILIGFETHSPALKFMVDLTTGKDLIEASGSYKAFLTKGNGRYVGVQSNFTHELRVFDAATLQFSAPVRDIKEEVVSFVAKGSPTPGKNASALLTTVTNKLENLLQNGDGDWWIGDVEDIDCDQFSLLSPNAEFVYCSGKRSAKWWIIR